MIDKISYETMKSKYGHVGSWAIWKYPDKTPKSNTDDMNWVTDPDLLLRINTGYVFVGLNWSSTHGDQSKGGTISWKNFHSGYSRQNDYKLRYALQGTKYEGSYMTDIIKLYAEVDSNKVSEYIREHPEEVKKNIIDFEEEISFLGDKPTLVAMGGQTYKILKDNLGNKYKILQIMHYSYTIGQEDYREKVLKVLDGGINL